MDDFTKEQAAQWVEQEVASCIARGEDPHVAATRYEADGEMFAMFADAMPNATAAGKALVARLRAMGAGA